MKIVYSISGDHPFECDHLFIYESGRFKINMLRWDEGYEQCYINISQKKEIFTISYKDIETNEKVIVATGGINLISSTIITNNCHCGSGNEQNENGNCGDCN